jgi:hypothetical protein
MSRRISITVEPEHGERTILHAESGADMLSKVRSFSNKDRW